MGFYLMLMLFLNRKKLVVDDCLRLRSVIEDLPPDRHYVPTLLVLSWANKPESKAEETQFTSLVGFTCTAWLSEFPLMYRSTVSEIC
jgi:hypothetical protein